MQHVAMTGRVTMLGISRWTGTGGSYRTIQRFYTTVIPWTQVFWQLFRERLLQQGQVYILAGDECVVSKAGKKTYGLDTSLRGCSKGDPGPLLFRFVLGSVEQHCSYPSRSSKPSAARKRKPSQAKKAAKKVQSAN